MVFETKYESEYENRHNGGKEQGRRSVDDSKSVANRRKAAERARKRYHANLEYYRSKSRLWNKKSVARIRNEAYEHYGHSCAICGESREEFISIDHINNDGKEHRTKVGSRSTYSVLADLKRLGWPQGTIQFLCLNCNIRKQIIRQKKEKTSPSRLIHDGILQKYGGRCSCCGVSDFDVLQIHPTSRSPTELLVELGQGDRSKGRWRMMAKLYQEPPSSDFTILCVNCNHAIRYYGECPHNEQLMVETGSFAVGEC